MSRPTPEQLNQLAEIMQAQAELSQATGCNQTIEIVFKSGHSRWINASNNVPATTNGLMMDEGYRGNSHPANRAGTGSLLTDKEQAKLAG